MAKFFDLTQLMQLIMSRNNSIGRDTLNYSKYYASTDLDQPLSEPITLEADTEEERHESTILETVFR